MAKFRSDALANPLFLKGLFTAANRAGSYDAIRKEREEKKKKKRERLERFGQYNTIADQGQTSVTEGSVAGRNAAVAKLREYQTREDITLEEAKEIERRIQALQGNQVETYMKNTNDARNLKAVFQIDQMLESGTNPELEATFKARKQELLNSPETREAYDQAVLQRQKDAATARNYKEAEWIRANGSAIQEAMMSDDPEEIETYLEGLGEFSAVARDHAQRMTPFINTLKKMEEKRIASGVEPQKYEGMIEEMFPKGVPRQLQAALTAYNKAVEKYYVDGQWTQGGKKVASNMEDAMLGIYKNLANQDAARERAQENAQANTVRDEIADLRKQLNSPISLSDVRQRANQLAGKKSGRQATPTEAQLAQAEQELREVRDAPLLMRIEALQESLLPPEEREAREQKRNEPQDDGGFTVKASDGSVITRNQALDYVRRGGREKAVEYLQTKGLSEGQINALLDGDMSVSEPRRPTQEEMITEPGLINPQRAKKKLRENSYYG